MEVERGDPAHGEERIWSVSLDIYKERIHSLPCVVCWKKYGRKVYGVEAHHAGDASDRNDWAQIPLCEAHHRGQEGIHGLHRRGFHRLYKTTDIELLAWTNELLHK